MADGFIMRAYEVSVYGYSEEKFFASSPAKARTKAWRAFTECRSCSFHDFLIKSSVRKVKPPQDFGKPITISGKPAFFIEWTGQYTRFVYPGSETILSSHPSDVGVAA